ncbi:hypothetical protein VHEMI05012 [[Torrubiella] hemipterigena]|uniref:DUF7721 domain-containing protein n=1 Tax=[Torrubiella] hemipterigena TaxID=1531966 RepID=A0A0A1TFJ4_9HYPO|nr:hypothetical protein VHEMI05012 [[Torrubiella] hemipterigena]
MDMNKLMSVGKEILAKSQNVNLDGDMKDAHQEANSQAGASGNSDLFANVLGSLSQQQSQIAEAPHVDEQDAVEKHEAAYNNDNNNASHDANSLGTAAAMQALKMFNQRGGDQNQSQGAFIGTALSEASKLFDDKSANGQVPSGTSKENVLQKAGEMAMKMYFKSQMDAGGSGGSAGNLMNLASKFLNK